MITKEDADRRLMQAAEDFHGCMCNSNRSSAAKCQAHNGYRILMLSGDGSYSSGSSSRVMGP